jgi:hypothetical protein
MTWRFLFFLQPTLFLDSVLFYLFIFCLFLFCISLFLHSCVSLIATNGSECSFLRVFFVHCHSFFHCYILAFFILFIYFTSSTLSSLFLLFVSYSN